MNAPIPADVLRYWLNMTLQYTGCTGEQAKSVAEYAAREALAKRPCGVWHAMHVVLKTPKCFCAHCKPAATFPVFNV